MGLDDQIAAARAESEERPDDAVAAHRLAALLDRGGHSEQAFSQYQRAIELDPGSAACVPFVRIVISGLRRGRGYLETVRWTVIDQRKPFAVHRMSRSYFWRVLIFFLVLIFCMYSPLVEYLDFIHAVILAAVAAPIMEWIARMFVSRRLLLDRRLQCAFLVPRLMTRGLPLRVRAFPFDQVRIRREWETPALTLSLTIADRYEVFMDTEIVSLPHPMEPRRAREYLLTKPVDEDGDWQPIEERRRSRP